MGSTQSTVNSQYSPQSTQWINCQHSQYSQLSRGQHSIVNTINCQCSQHVVNNLFLHINALYVSFHEFNASHALFHEVATIQEITTLAIVSFSVAPLGCMTLTHPLTTHIGRNFLSHPLDVTFGSHPWSHPLVITLDCT